MSSAYVCGLIFIAACTHSCAEKHNDAACSVDVSYWKLASLLTENQPRMWDDVKYELVVHGHDVHEPPEVKGAFNIIERAAQKDMQKKLADIKQAQDDLKQEHQDLKEHTLNRLDAIDEKIEWFLSKGQQGAHPLSDRISQIESLLNTTLLLIRDIKGPPQNCQDVYDRGSRTSGVYMISPDGITKMNVYCEQDLDGGGWMVFQRRQDGSVDFYRDWAYYKTGFGNLSGEFWLGNDNLQLLTKHHDQKLKVELTYNDVVKYADYSTFWIDSESQKYKLTVSGFSGSSPPGDSLAYHNQSAFSTKDRDTDVRSIQCAQQRKGAWWYKNCLYSNLNGVYGSTDGKGVIWYDWQGDYISMTGTRMMVKRKN